jgi:translation initiation factor IF-1
MKEESIKMNGKIVEVLPNAMFRVLLSNQHVILCSIGGKLRKNNINVKMNDNVDIEMSPYDITRGRITYRYK